MNRSGFTLVELVVGMLILTVGVMGLAGSTGYVSLQMRAADLRTDRSMAQQRVIEQLYATEFDDVVGTAKGSGTSVGDYTIWWDVTSLRWALKEVDVLTEGPGYEAGHRKTSVLDTVTVRIARPNS